MSQRSRRNAPAKNSTPPKQLLLDYFQTAIVTAEGAAREGTQMAKAKSRQPERWQLGLTFADPTPVDEAAAQEQTDVPPADRGVSDPLPADIEGGANRPEVVAGLSGEPGGGDAGDQAANSGATPGERTALELVAAGNGGRAGGAGVVPAPRLKRQTPQSAELQQGGLFGLEPEAAITELDRQPMLWPIPATPASEATSEEPTSGFRLEDATSTSGLKAKAKATIAAIRLLKTLEAAGRAATAEEKAILAGFSGFGMLANRIFPAPGTTSTSQVGRCWARNWPNCSPPKNTNRPNVPPSTPFTPHPPSCRAFMTALARLGVPPSGIHALEPGCGIGNFIGRAPQGMHFTGIEKEVLSGRIARVLYPAHDIRIEPFQKTSLPAGSMDVVVGNVPFSDLTLKWQESKLPLHDYFFAKSLDSLHEGGVLALVTSRYTLDKQDPTFREYLAEQADFLGAIRLPKGAFRQEGTEVVTDVIFLRKRGKEQSPQPRWRMAGDASLARSGTPTATAIFWNIPKWSSGNWRKSRACMATMN